MSSLEKRTPRFQFVNGQGNFPRGQYNVIRFLAAMDRLDNFNDQDLEDDLGNFEQSENLLNMQRIKKTVSISVVFGCRKRKLKFQSLQFNT